MALQAPPSQDGAILTVIAIDTDKNCQSAVKWAVDNILSKALPCLLVHVRTLNAQPYDFSAMPKGTLPPTESEMRRLFLPYRGFCARKGIDSKDIVLHDLNISSALIDYINTNAIGCIIVGASNRSALTRKFKPPDVPSSLIKSVPDFCSVYVISKGKVQTVRPATRSVAHSRAPLASLSPPQKLMPHHLLDSPQTLSKFTIGSKNSSPTFSRENLNIPFHKPAYPDSTSDSSFTGPFSFRSTDASSDNLEFSCGTGSSVSSVSSLGTGEMEAEMRRLKLELKQTMDMYNTACREAVSAKQRERELHQQMTLDANKFEEAKIAEEAALTMMAAEKRKNQTAMEAAQMTKWLAEMEAEKRKKAEMKTRGGDEKERGTGAYGDRPLMYRQYTIQEIEAATNFFSSSLKIGEGGYGPVYKATLEYTPVAIKVLRPDAAQGRKQFQQEVEVLSCMRHPHMVLLLGACAEYGCLVYEYMDNGSLEDRLFRKNNSRPISWQARFRIATEIATALLFLHQAKPEPLVHRDLKPANILLDRNYVSKISDVGLARLVPQSVADSVTHYHMTAAAGTFCYIDPEYQQTGMLGVKSDIYSLGVMLLQIITAMPPMGLALKVEGAIERGTFADILDQSVKDWPVEEALSFAKMALKCCELRKKDRPDLGSVVLPQLQHLRNLGKDNGDFKGMCSGPNSFDSGAYGSFESGSSQGRF
ncbi:U-box domain-containing protein 35-like [Malania oleifera]|uniref:U-box domain-containing protein 35-like n=1 Tax=Malania oleifera TaxID=397392 RepID=UPI0025ADDE02|nr:U-box domain-containing protein 35-like [Malania oleifera]